MLAKFGTIDGFQGGPTHGGARFPLVLRARTRLSEAFEEWGPARPDPREVDSPPPEYSLQCDYCGGMGASDTLGGSGPTLCESCEESL